MCNFRTQFSDCCLIVKLAAGERQGPSDGKPLVYLSSSVMLSVKLNGKLTNGKPLVQVLAW